MVPGEFSSLDPDPSARGAFGMALELDQDMIPAFRAGPRDRLRSALAGHMVAADRVLLDLSWAMLADRHPDGHRVVGPGDLELGAVVRLPIAEPTRRAALAQGRRGPSFGLGWRVKLPNAADEGELGSDETDVALLACGAADFGPLRAWAGGGLAILGDPLMLAAQDDIAFAQAGLGWDAALPAWAPHPELRAGVALPSPSNPLRSELGLALGWGSRWGVGLTGGLGLSAAAPTARIGLSVERRFGPASPADWPGDPR